jgi:hypothetical protein
VAADTIILNTATAETAVIGEAGNAWSTPSVTKPRIRDTAAARAVGDFRYRGEYAFTAFVGSAYTHKLVSSSTRPHWTCGHKEHFDGNATHYQQRSKIHVFPLFPRVV